MSKEEITKHKSETHEVAVAKFECSKDEMPNQRLLPYFAKAS